MTETQYQRSRLDHDREIRYNREGQMRETQLEIQLRGVKGLMVDKAAARCACPAD
jgi:hypothetical protein